MLALPYGLPAAFCAFSNSIPTSAVVLDALRGELQEELADGFQAGGRQRHHLGQHRLAAQHEQLLHLLAGLRRRPRRVPLRQRALRARAAKSLPGLTLTCP